MHQKILFYASVLGHVIRQGLFFRLFGVIFQKKTAMQNHEIMKCSLF